ncbi:arsenate reductase [Rhodospirillales bacterium]|nr:arsenate reductase [Rhodospirillales bacterium]
MLKVYGIKNCDKCSKARKWMEANGMLHTFLDVRSDGISESDLERWADTAGIDKLLNRRGTTWRGLSDAEKEAADGGTAIALMMMHPALIKRPVFDDGKNVFVGFDKKVQKELSAG